MTIEALTLQGRARSSDPYVGCRAQLYGIRHVRTRNVSFPPWLTSAPTYGSRQTEPLTLILKVLDPSNSRSFCNLIIHRPSRRLSPIIACPAYSTALPLRLLTAVPAGYFPFAERFACPFLVLLTGLFFAACASFTKAPHVAHLFLPFPTTFFATRYSGQWPAVGVSTSLRGCLMLRLPGNQWLMGSIESGSMKTLRRRRLGVAEKPVQILFTKARRPVVVDMWLVMVLNKCRW